MLWFLSKFLNQLSGKQGSRDHAAEKIKSLNVAQFKFELIVLTLQSQMQDDLVGLVSYPESGSCSEQNLEKKPLRKEGMKMYMIKYLIIWITYLSQYQGCVCWINSSFSQVSFYFTET